MITWCCLNRRLAWAVPCVNACSMPIIRWFRRLRDLPQRRGGTPLSRMEQNARAHLMLSLSHGARHWIDHYEPDDYARVATRIGDILIDGFAGAAPPPSSPDGGGGGWGSSREAEMGGEWY